MNTPTLESTVSATFLDALGRQDFDRLGACFHPNPRARLLTPSALAMPQNAAGVGDRFRQWFGAADVLEIERSEVNAIGATPGASGGCTSIRYCLHLHEHGVWYTCEQQVYCWVKDGAIERIDLLCSGFQPVAEQGEQ